jgi:hypothetical protein
MRYLKIVPTDFLSDSRDKREVNLFKSLGFETTVIFKGPSNYEHFDVLGNFLIRKKITNQNDRLIFKLKNRLTAIFKIIIRGRKIFYRADEIFQPDPDPKKIFF